METVFKIDVVAVFMGKTYYLGWNMACTMALSAGKQRLRSIDRWKSKRLLKLMMDIAGVMTTTFIIEMLT